ncbi:MAG: DUF2442 domain-containing protein [Gammaproteobacteria bacterium]|nr:MAG: DUF2442 domain-containing protein [Gammaproteobacteria bacterium]
MIKVIHVEAKPGYVLSLTFNDGLQGEISIEDRLFGEMFEPLKESEYFSQVTVDEYGVVCWPNEADLATDVLYDKVSKQH